MILQGFFRCPCGKLHTYSGITLTSVCPECGRGLNSLMINGNASIPARVFHERLAMVNAQLVRSVLNG